MIFIQRFIAGFLLVLPLFGNANNHFEKGPLLKDYGANVVVNQTHPVVAEQKFKVVFDVAELGDSNKINHSFNSAARFLNMQVRAGVDPENIQLALVVHGKAGDALLQNEQYQKKYQRPNPNIELLKLLMQNQVRVILCGQSAAYYQISNNDIIEGAEMALSAMTGHALLQQQGYTLNPF